MERLWLIGRKKRVLALHHSHCTVPSIKIQLKVLNAKKIIIIWYLRYKGIIKSTKFCATQKSWVFSELTRSGLKVKVVIRSGLKVGVLYWQIKE
jgi:hypothetical protein